MAVAAREFFDHVEGFIDYRKTIYEVSDQTIKSNRTDLKLFEDFICQKDYALIDGPAVMAFQYHLKEARENSGQSINRKIFTLRSYSHFLRLRDVAQAEQLPFYDVAKIRQGYRNRPDALTAGQLKQIFDAVDRSTCLGIRDYAAFALMYLCGLRVGEVFGLNLESIDPDKRNLNVIGKGRRPRCLHLNDEMFKVLSEYLAVRKHFHKDDQTSALFVSKKGNRLAIRTMNFKKLIAKAGIKTRFNVTCHTLRHTFASHLNDKDVDMLVIQSLMGHSTSRSTEPYIHSSQRKMREALERLPGVIHMNKLIGEGGLPLHFQRQKVQRM